MTHTASHVIVSVVTFAKKNYKPALACVASFILGALLF